MSNRKPYAPRFNKDPAARKLIVVLRMAGFPLWKIAQLTGRHEKTIELELKRPEHKKLFRKYVMIEAKKRLSGKALNLIEDALSE